MSFRFLPLATEYSDSYYSSVSSLTLLAHFLNLPVLTRLLMLDKNKVKVVLLLPNTRNNEKNLSNNCATKESKALLNPV